MVTIEESATPSGICSPINEVAARIKPLRVYKKHECDANTKEQVKKFMFQVKNVLQSCNFKLLHVWFK